MANEDMTAEVEYYNGAVKFYTSEDKHANYPSESVGASVRLLYVGDPEGLGLI